MIYLSFDLLIIKVSCYALKMPLYVAQDCEVALGLGQKF